eukprot:TRINITY_DN44151_c0_g1_i1.p1 TRINITY_DN44151_c0_g1~~TRINITY_DN44151_c0_g1_i1.p1  ORF type:complete len:421 (+),score=162.90 TRINITY_DN44151_c0_g1_i1:60-1265(+)
MDLVALLFSVLGGFFMGSYPVPIKAPSVIEANVHPIVFQCYKSFWVFTTGWIFLIVRAAGARHEPGGTFEFTWWGVASAAGWIPSGLGTIASVPLLGVGMAIVVNTGTAALLSFLVFWLVLGEDMKKHHASTGDYYLAPLWLACILVGMAGLVLSPRMKLPCVPEQDEEKEEADEEADGPSQRDRSLLGDKRIVEDTYSEVSSMQVPKKKGASLLFLGLLAALCAGIFSAVQFGIVNAGKQYEQNQEGCRHCKDQCSDKLKEQFDNFGSWMVSFGIGAAMVTSSFLAIYAVYRKAIGQGFPDMHFRTLRVPGTIAGICWALGAFFQTAAVVRGGSATVMPANLACQLITSGLWGIFYYKEIRGWHAVIWGVIAVFTLAAMALLGQEKESDSDHCVTATVVP